MTLAQTDIRRSEKQSEDKRTTGMVRISGGAFRMGADHHAAEEAPAHRVIPRKVNRGGPHFCAPNYRRRYRPAARHAEPVDTSTSHVSFRCVIRRAGTNERSR